MKFTSKLISMILVIAAVASLSSCYVFNNLQESSSGADRTNTTVTTGDVNNYNVTITPSTEETVAATSKALMSAVSILTETAQGSGVIFKLSDDKSTAYILTNYHVVYNTSKKAVSKNIAVYLYGQESQLYGNVKPLDYTMVAEYVGGTATYDLAVLKITNSKVLMESHARACDFADSNSIAVLETAIAVGNAEGGGISATMGKVNVESEDIVMSRIDNGKRISLRVIRTDAAVNSGNSGGGLFNSKGNLIGIVNAKSADYTVDGFGYAIPSNVARYIAENIIHYCDGNNSLFSAYRCLLGVNVEIAALYTEYDAENGILRKNERVAIKSVNDGAAATGILRQGDVINFITIDGKVYEVKRMFHVVDAMLNARVESEIVINVTRGTEKLDLSIKLNQSNIVNADS